MSGATRDVLHVVTFVVVDDVIIRVSGVAMSGGTTSASELTGLAQTLRAP